MEEKKVTTSEHTGLETIAPSHRAKKERTVTIKLNNKTLMSVALVVLIVVSFAQAIELNTLEDKISSDEVQAATTSTVTSGTGQSTNLQELPDMVGGC